jgi:hypothetical protein
MAEPTNLTVDCLFDLASWKIEKWCKIERSTDERGGNVIFGYVKDPDVAASMARGIGWYGGDGTATDAFVLTQNGLNGFLVARESVATMTDEDKKREEIRAGAIQKLTPEERRLLKFG